MRILHVNKFLYRRGGAESYMLDVAALQEAAGHEVEFFGMQHPDNPPLRFSTHFPPYVQLEPPPSGVGRRLAASVRMVWSPSARRGIDEVVESFRPDVVHLHNIYHQLSPSVLRPLAERRIPTVMTLHDYKLVCPSYLLLDHGKVCDACLDGHFVHAVARRCKDGSLGSSAVLAFESGVHRRFQAYGPVRVLICPSRFMAAKIAQGGVYADRLAVLNNFMDARGVTPKGAPGGNVVYAGRLSFEKGVDVLIQSVSRLGAVQLHIAGDGPEQPALERLAAACAPGRVSFHGRLPREQVLDLIRSAAVLVMPSRCYENQPMAVLEAFVCGVPVVTTDLGGLPELVAGGCYGEIVPAGNVKALAVALERMLADLDRTFAMGQAARTMALEHFAPERHLTGLERLYRRAGSSLVE